jgi:arylsulfatase A-like enzyme
VPLFVWSAQHGIHGELDTGPAPPAELLSEQNQLDLAALSARAATGDFWAKRILTASVLMSVDNSLQRLVEVMEATGMLSNAVIFVNSDNGAQADSTRGHPGNNFPMRSMKFSYFEGGIRVPAFVYAPGRLAPSRVGGSYHGLMHHVDLLATFVELGSGTPPDPAYGLDSVSHWLAITGDGSSPRNELVLNLPRSPMWRIGQNATSEGVALRVGKYKLLLNHAYDGWWAPQAGHETQMAFEHCEYKWYTVAAGANCTFDNFLFDVEDDPNEKFNLWGVSDFDAIQSKLISRAEKLAAAQGSYGSIMYAMYMNTDRATTNYTTAWKANSWYVSPWGCEVVP